MRIEDVLKINIVLVGVQLLRNPGERAVFDSLVGTEVHGATGEEASIPPVPSGFLPPILWPAQSQILMLQRERTTLELLPDNSTISRDYPNPEDVKRLSDVAGIAIEQSNLQDQELRSFGFNIDVVCELSPSERAYQFMANRVFAPNLLHESGYSLIGASSRLNFFRDGIPWNLIIEPRFGNPNSNRVFMRLNLHRDGNVIPNRSAIATSLIEVWNQVIAIAENLNRSN